MATIERIRGALAGRTHLGFMKYMWQRDDPFIIGQHTKDITQKIDVAIKKYKQGISSYLAIKVPVRHGKSDIVSRYLPPHFMGMFPDAEVMVSSYSASLTKTFSRDAIKIIRDERYKNVYPNIRLSKTQQSADIWGIENRHGKVHWIGLGGSATGKGANCSIIDDFFKNREEAESETMRNNVWDSISNDILSRLAPVHIVIILATPWHVDDPFGRIKKKMEEDERFPKFEEIKYPAFSNEYPEGILFPERYSMDWYESERAFFGPYGSSGLLQCDPVIKGGNIFRTDKIQIIEKMPDIEYTRGWDLASSEKQRVKEDPDFTVGIKCGLMKIPTSIPNESLNVLYVADMIKGRWEAPKRDAIIKNTALGDGYIEIGVEAFGPYKDAYTSLSKTLYGLRTVKKLQLPGDKVTKAGVLEPIFEAGNIYLKKADWNEDFIREIGEFPSGAHDDIVDALVVAFETHSPFKKKMFPFEYTSKKNIEIKWEETGPRNSLHYAAIVQHKDMSLWVVQIMWDNVKGQLFVYDAWKNEGDLKEVALVLRTKMKLNEYRHEKILVNEAMEAKEEHVLSSMQVLKREFHQINTRARITKSVRFDQMGSINTLNRLFSQGKIIVSDICDEAALQFSNWSVEKGKPEKDMGFCEALCLIASELRRIKIIKEKLMIKDYVDSETYANRKQKMESFYAK